MLLVGFFYVLTSAFAYKSSLPLISSYDLLDYPLTAHRRHRRSVDDAVIIKFRSQGRKFHLILHPSSNDDVIAQDHVLDVNGVPEEPPRLAIFEGYLKDDPRSYVRGTLTDGIFDGVIVTSNGTYYAEKSSKYNSAINAGKRYHHSIIYSDSDIDHEPIERHRRSIYGRGCAMSGEVERTMRHLQHSAVSDQPSPASANNENTQAPYPHLADEESTVSRYSDPHLLKTNWHRSKRQIGDGFTNGEARLPSRDHQGLFNVRTCTMYIQTDQRLWDHVFKNEGQQNGQRTREEIYNLIDNHIRAVKQIYESTDFHGITGITFVVQRITIFDSSSCDKLGNPTARQQADQNPFCDGNVDVSYFLNLNSKKDHSSFCLAYALTYRDFIGGTLGLAWVASANSGLFCLRPLSWLNSKDHSSFCLAYALTYRDFIGGTLGLAWVASANSGLFCLRPLSWLNSKDHSSFCLAYALTYRDFIGGTLGLAWVASANSGLFCLRPLSWLNSKDHSSFCLAYALTYRDFIGGTLGLAWVASANSGLFCLRPLSWLNSKDHSSFCLAYALTYRDFIGGTLGLAWVASANSGLFCLRPLSWLNSKDHSSFCLAYALTYRDFIGGTLGLAWVASANSGLFCLRPLSWLNSKDHSSFCLAYALTYRDFIGGTLGLAWVASANSGSSGGICEVYKAYNEGKSRIKRSLNTGIITLVNYNNRVPPKVSQLTLAHEIGHSFGAQHDPERCQPGPSVGNYIMFASATSGDKKNNALFSECSKENISQVMREILKLNPIDINNPKQQYETRSKRNCLQQRADAFCGNRIVEGKEKCDCGFNDKECREREDRQLSPGQSPASKSTCCIPHDEGRSSKTWCTLRPGKTCSPSQGPCCSNQCGHSPVNKICQLESECTRISRCNGYAPTCPPPSHKADQTACQNNTKMCNNGTCESSICEIIGMSECYLKVKDNKRKCELACTSNQKDPSACKSSFDLPQLRKYYQGDPNSPGRRGIMMRPGQPCDNYLGYCDVRQICRTVDSSGPLSRLKDLLFNPNTFRNIGKWIEEHWWAVILIGIGVTLFMALFIKCCAVHTPSSNPNRPEAQSIYETLRHPASTLLRSETGRRHRERGSGSAGEHRQHHHRHRRHRNQEGPQGGGGRPRSSGQQQQPRTSRSPPGQPTSPNGVPVEPPPPYSAAPAGGASANLPGPAGPGPARGHRKNRDQKSKV